MSLWLTTLRTTGARIPCQSLAPLRLPRAMGESFNHGSRASFTKRLVQQSAVRRTPIVIYRGPQAMRKWLTIGIGTSFFVVGAELAYGFYFHLTWPPFSSESVSQKKLVNEAIRGIAAGVACSIGIVAALVFFAVPARTVTKLSLDVAKRELTITTGSRGFSALLPRAIYPGPLRRTAELRGFYQTRKNNERVVPLSDVYRLRGSAVAANAGNNNIVKTDRGSLHVGIENNRNLIFKVGKEKLWYVLESAGGAKPNARGYMGFWRRLSYRLRGLTEWEGVPVERRSEPLASTPSRARAEPRILGEKEPWFLDRRAFDDIFPFVARR